MDGLGSYDRLIGFSEMNETDIFRIAGLWTNRMQENYW